jgi:ATP-dependent Lhr-like helicase
MSVLDLLDREVASAFYGRFPTLRPAQEAAIEPLSAGKSIVLTAGTASGKTEAVVAPLLNGLWRRAAASDQLMLLYVAPTKALVNDIEKRLLLPAQSLGLRIGVRHGDRDDLAAGRPAHVLVTTPESLDVMLFRGDPALPSVRAVVVDEVHLLYNTQRGLQLSVLLRRLERAADRHIQWAALSATIGCLAHVRDFLFGKAEATFLNFPTNRLLDAQIRLVRGDDSLRDLVRRMVGHHPTKLLMFANSRRECESLAAACAGVDQLRGSVFAHYSSLSPQVRLETEQAYAAARTAVCIATSTLELGIDIGDIDAVLLWGVPGGVESFLQRIGRGNRRGNKTNVVCLVPPSSTSPMLDGMLFSALAESARLGRLPIRSPYCLYGAAAQQCLDVIASYEGRFTRIADLCQLFDHLPHLQRPVIEEILAELASKGYLQRHGYKNRYGADQRLHELVDYKFIYGNFAAASQMVEVYHGGKILGEVPAINLLRIRPGASVRFKAATWRVQKASRDQILLQTAKGRDRASDFVYPGSGPGADAFMCNCIWEWLVSSSPPADHIVGHLRDVIERDCKRFRSVVAVGQVPYARTEQGLRYLTFAGHLVNRAIGLITGQPGFVASDFWLEVPSPIDWAGLPNNVQGFARAYDLLPQQSAEQSLYQTLLPVPLQREEVLQEWLNDGAIATVLARLADSRAMLIDPAVATGLL